MNWGYKLLITFVLFGSMILYMVYRCVNTPVDLVTKEYYRDEIAYQQVIDGVKHADALGSKISVTEESEAIWLHMPQEMKNHHVLGTALFYCAADATKDRKFSLQPDANGSQSWSRSLFKPGYYVLKINWSTSGIDYYSEQSIVIH